jgi:diguanylate cyclase (GGDEF)-like protein
MIANILVIDADQLVVQLLEKALGKSGHKVTAVDDPVRGLLLLDQHAFDLVITGLDLPRLSGLHVLERVKALDESIQVIVFAGPDEETFENAIAALRLGAADFLTKPLRNMDELMVAVERALEKRGLAMTIRQLNQSLERMSNTDFLTGLPTRRYFLERVSIELRRTRRHKKHVSCLMIDIDHLDQINKTYGRPAGDQVLVYVAREVMKDRRITDILGRYGGGVFVLVLPETSSEQALLAAEKIRQGVESGGFTFGNQPVEVTVRIGVAGAQGATTITDLINQAQHAVKEARQAGRNCVRVSGAAVSSS